MLKRPHDWPYVVFTDEASFWLNKSQPNKMWLEDDTEVEGRGVHGPKLHLWGGITSKGALGLVIFEDNLDAKAYLTIMRAKVRELDDLFPEGWIWQQDGSGVHRANSVGDFITKNIYYNLDFPPYSPDLSPIENIWGWLKREVNKEMPRNVEALKACVKKHWARLDESFLCPYFDSMPERMEEVIRLKGSKTKY